MVRKYLLHYIEVRGDILRPNVTQAVVKINRFEEHTHARTHARSHTHTHTLNKVSKFSGPDQLVLAN